MSARAPKQHESRLAYTMEPVGCRSPLCFGYVGTETDLPNEISYAEVGYERPLTETLAYVQGQGDGLNNKHLDFVGAVSHFHEV